MNFSEIDPIIEAALIEDMPGGDITSESVVPSDAVSRAVLLAKQEGVLAGVGVAERVFYKLDPHIEFQTKMEDGSDLQPGIEIAVVSGSSTAMLKGERTALNFLQRLCGIATSTKRYVEILAGTRTKVLDTRKTSPGLRVLEKYAVKCGGGTNHRKSLSDMVIIKDNHIRLVGSIPEAVKRARSKVRPDIKIEVETTDLKEVMEALKSGADIIMLDNMSVSQMKDAVEWVAGRVPLEASGNINLETARAAAEIGVDYISVGCLTHSVQALDISMEFLH